MKKFLIFVAVSLFTSLGFSVESELCNSILKTYDKPLALSLSIDKDSSALSMDLPTPWSVRTAKYKINQLDCRDSQNIKIHSSSINGDQIFLQMTPDKKESFYKGILFLKNGQTSYITWKCAQKNISELCK